jgi:hypothetical protein
MGVRAARLPVLAEHWKNRSFFHMVSSGRGLPEPWTAPDFRWSGTEGVVVRGLLLCG